MAFFLYILSYCIIYLRKPSWNGSDYTKTRRNKALKSGYSSSSKHFKMVKFWTKSWWFECLSKFSHWCDHNIFMKRLTDGWTDGKIKIYKKTAWRRTKSPLQNDRVVGPWPWVSLNKQKCIQSPRGEHFTKIKWKYFNGQRGCRAETLLKCLNLWPSILWTWPWVNLFGLCVQHIILQRRTFDQSLMKFFQRIEEKWSKQKF